VKIEDNAMAGNENQVEIRINEMNNETNKDGSSDDLILLSEKLQYNYNIDEKKRTAGELKIENKEILMRM
jgi:hypothetical protein